MTRPAWHAATTDSGRTATGRHRADPGPSRLAAVWRRRLDRIGGLR